MIRPAQFVRGHKVERPIDLASVRPSACIALTKLLTSVTHPRRSAYHRSYKGIQDWVGSRFARDEIPPYSAFSLTISWRATGVVIARRVFTIKVRDNHKFRCLRRSISAGKADSPRSLPNGASSVATPRLPHERWRGGSRRGRARLRIYRTVTCVTLPSSSISSNSIGSEACSPP